MWQWPRISRRGAETRRRRGGALPVPVQVDMDVRHYRSMVDEGADERKLQELFKRNEELKLRIYLSRRLLRNVDR